MKEDGIDVSSSKAPQTRWEMNQWVLADSREIDSGS